MWLEDKIKNLVFKHIGEIIDEIFAISHFLVLLKLKRVSVLVQKMLLICVDLCHGSGGHNATWEHQR